MEVIKGTVIRPVAAPALSVTAPRFISSRNINDIKNSKYKIRNAVFAGILTTHLRMLKTKNTEAERETTTTKNKTDDDAKEENCFAKTTTLGSARKEKSVNTKITARMVKTECFNSAETRSESASSSDALILEKSRNIPTSIIRDEIVNTT